MPEPRNSPGKRVQERHYQCLKSWRDIAYSCCREDAKRIIPLVDFYSPHNIASPKDVKKCKFKGEKIIYDNDGWTRCKDVYGTAVEALKQGRGFALLELKPLDPELINYTNLEALERAILVME